MVALAVTFVAEVVHFFSLSLPQQVREIPDDSFFYLQLGLRFWETGEFTFDGDSQTYGFQPLWQLFSIVMALALPTAKSLFLGVFVVCAALHVAIAWQLFRLGRACSGVGAGVVAAILWAWNPSVMSWCWGLKENALYAFLLVTAFLQLLAVLRGSIDRRAAVWLGIVLGIMAFNRINSVAQAGIILGMLVGAVGLAGGLRNRLRVAVIAGAVAAAIAAPWFLFAWWHFGTAMPTSGTFKLALMKAHVEQGWKTPWMSVAHVQHALGLWPAYLAYLFEAGYSMVRPIIVAGAATATVLAVVGRFSAARIPLLGPGAWPVLVVVIGFGCCAALSSFVNQMVLPGYLAYARWYAVPEFALVALVAGALLASCWRPRFKAVGLAVGALTLALSWWAWPPVVVMPHLDERAVFEQQPEKAQLIEMGQWARDHVPGATGIGIWDPGIVSYFSSKRLVSFDPLMNSLSYQQTDILDPVGYVKKCKIAYMMGVASQQNGAWFYVPLPPTEHEIVWLPYPGHDVGFTEVGDKFMVLVRPLQSPVAECLDEDDFPCGILYPNDPSRRRVVTRDRDRLLAGESLAADIVRLWVNVPQGAPDLVLRADEQEVRTVRAGTKGFIGVDVRNWRGQKLSVSWPGGDASAVISQAHLVDYTW